MTDRAPSLARQRARWIDRLWTLCWAGTVILVAMRGLGWVTGAEFAELVYIPWVLFGGVEIAKGTGSAVAQVFAARNRKD